MISYSCTVVFIHATGYVLAYHVLHTEHMEVQLSEVAKRGQDDTVLPSTYPVHGSVSELNHSGADAVTVILSSFILLLSI